MTPDDLIYEYYSQNKLMRAIESVYILINYDKYKWEEGRKEDVWAKNTHTTSMTVIT